MVFRVLLVFDCVFLCVLSIRLRVSVWFSIHFCFGFLCVFSIRLWFSVCFKYSFWLCVCFLKYRTIIKDMLNLFHDGMVASCDRFCRSGCHDISVCLPIDALAFNILFQAFSRDIQTHGSILFQVPEQLAYLSAHRSLIISNTK